MKGQSCEDEFSLRHRASHSSLTACLINGGMLSRLPQPRAAALAYHATMIGLLPPLYAEGRRIAHKEFYPHVQHASLLHPEGPPRWFEPPTTLIKEPSTDFSKLLAEAEGSPALSPVGEKQTFSGSTLDIFDPACATPPTVPSLPHADPQCLSPFELEPSTAQCAEAFALPLKPSPIKPSPRLEDLGFPSPREPLAFANEAEYADFIDCILAV